MIQDFTQLSTKKAIQALEAAVVELAGMHQNLLTLDHIPGT